MAKAPADQPLVLLHLSDTHLHSAADSRMRGVITLQTFGSVLDHATRSPSWPPTAILATGDIVQDESRAGYERFRVALESKGLPVLCLPGNHDDPDLMREVLDRPPFQVCGHVTLGNWCLILLNTFQPNHDGGELGPTRLAELEATLRAHTNHHVLVCMHHQPLPMGSTWLDGVGLSDADAFLRIIDAAPQVRGIVWGHVHQASDRERNGVRYLSTPSTCSQFKPGSDSFAMDDLPPGLRWIKLHPDGRIETRIEWVERT